MEQSNVLYVQMFGSFQMHYQGHPMTGGKQRDTYFTNLMQILLHNVSAGVSRDYLEDVLLGDRDVGNRHQALQTIVYKAKRKLKNMGLEDANYIRLENGIYYWTPQIPVCEDAAVFDALYNQTVEFDTKEEKTEEQLEICLEACYQYTGEFLPMNMVTLWVSAEARRYRKQFYECVEKAAFILREKEDWVRLEELGRYVTGVAPFSDWECLIMEALVESGQYDEAKKLYADTVDSYFREQGIYPSAKFMEMIKKLGNQIQHSYEVLDQIQQNLLESPEDVAGGYQCSYPVFCGIYQAVCRMMERGGQSIYLMLCTIVDSNGNPMGEKKSLEKMSVKLNDAIRESVRHGDVISQYGRGQFLVLLVNITREDCDIVEERINRKFITGRQRIGVQYHVNSVVPEN